MACHQERLSGLPEPGIRAHFHGPCVGELCNSIGAVLAFSQLMAESEPGDELNSKNP